MIDRRRLMGGVSCIVLMSQWHGTALAVPRQVEPAARLRLVRIVDADHAEIALGEVKAILARGEVLGTMTLIELAGGASPFAVLEDLTMADAPLHVVGPVGVIRSFGKTAASTAQDVGGYYYGRTWQEVADSPTDMLGAMALRSGDPLFAEVEAAFPPIRKVWGDTYNFLGTPESMDKVWFMYGGRSPNFDPAVYHRPIEEIRKRGEVRDGLAGGHLPILRFVYPEWPGTYTEMLAFAPFRSVNGNERFQPVWYRVMRVEAAKLVWVRHVDSFLPYPPRESDPPEGFYRDLLGMSARWDEILADGPVFDIPDQRMADQARHSMIRAMMGRSAGFPKYGTVDKNYGGSEHDGFPDTFTVETSAMLEWGLLGRAGAYIDNYFGKFVRDDGVILYRGPETGQFGRMLTLVGRFAQLGGDPELLRRHARRIDAVADTLLSMRAKAKALPQSDPAHGMISGWSEADAVLEPDPARFMQPYFSNSTEAIRGFRELAGVWDRIGLRERAALLRREADELQIDLQRSIMRSTLVHEGERIIPSIAGASEPFHVVLQRDRSDPQWRSYRSWMEMLQSAVLTREQANSIIDYRGRHHDVVLGMPMAYGYRTGEMAGFLSYGHGYGLIRADRIPEALLMTYSSMAHQYTRGMWLAPETRRLAKDEWSAAYCSPAQLVVPLMLRWLVAFEEPDANVLWLGKGAPEHWLAPGQTYAVSHLPTRWGRAGYRLASSRAGVSGSVDMPEQEVEVRLRLRRPGARPLRMVTVNGKPWKQFDAAAAIIILPPGMAGRVAIRAGF